MSEHWDTYVGNIEDKLASVVIDMDIFRETDTEEYCHSFCLRLIVKQPNEDGFPIGTEADKMAEVEDSCIELLSHQHFINVGRVTTDGARDVVFYSNQKDRNSLIEAAELFIKPSGIQFEIFAIEEDEKWGFYFDFLYPNQYQREHMGNRLLIESLEESGDKLEIPRKVDHLLYFDNIKMMKRFSKEVLKNGFSVDDEEIDEEGKYSLLISRVDPVDFHSINEVTDFLVEILEKYEGEYDGWGTVVIEG